VTTGSLVVTGVAGEAGGASATAGTGVARRVVDGAGPTTEVIDRAFSPSDLVAAPSASPLIATTAAVAARSRLPAVVFIVVAVRWFMRSILSAARHRRLTVT